MTENKNAPLVKIPVILGPTAVGKTDLAMYLCEKFGFELMSCDSRQIYRFMNIGTAKPTALQQKSVRHWMIDTVDPDQGFSCFQFAQQALEIIRRSRQDGKHLLLCGGSGLYFNILSKGMGPAAPPDMKFREMYFEKARTQGKQAVFEELARVDPVTAAGTHPSNVQRNIRALEVFYQSQTPLSAQKQNARPPQGLDFFVMICSMSRSNLYDRINDRVDTMVQEGLLDEFYSLREKGYGPSSPGMQCVGYRELFAVEEKKSSLRKAVDTIKMNTRHYAKRQITWLRHQISGHEIAMDKPDYGSVEKMIRHYLSAPDDKSSPGATAQ